MKPQLFPVTSVRKVLEQQRRNCALILAHWVLKIVPRLKLVTYLSGVLAFQRLSATTSCHRGTSRQTGKLCFPSFPSPCLKELCVTKSIEIQRSCVTKSIEIRRSCVTKSIEIQRSCVTKSVEIQTVGTATKLTEWNIITTQNRWNEGSVYK